jgi:general stress protein CsbA
MGSCVFYLYAVAIYLLCALMAHSQLNGQVTTVIYLTMDVISHHATVTTVVSRLKRGA